MNELRCENCDLFDCNCFCKCGLSYDCCVCEFSVDDWNHFCDEQQVIRDLKILGLKVDDNLS